MTSQRAGAGALQREVARAAGSLCQPVEPVGEHVQLAGERHFEDELLLLVDEVFERVSSPVQSW